MNRKKELAKNTFILSIGTFLPKLASIVTIPIITGELTKTEYGTYDLLTTLASLLIPIITLQIQSAAFRFLIDYRKDDSGKKKVITNIYSFSIVVVLLSLGVLFLVASKINVLTRLLIVLYVGTDAVITITLQVARGLSYNRLYSLTSVIRSFINMVLIVLALAVMHLGLNGVLVAYVCETILGISILVIGCKLIRFIDFNEFSFDFLKQMLSYSWPMIPHMISGWILRVSDRFVLNAFAGVEAVAVYAAANKIPMLFLTFQGTFGNAWQENASLAVDDDGVEEYYSFMFDKIFCILTGIMALLICSSPLLFKLLIKGDYQEAYPQMPILFLGMYFCGVTAFLGGIYIAHKKTKSVGVTTLLAAVINLVVDLLLVKRFGIYAASISTLVSYLFLTVYRMFDVKKFQMIKYKYVKIIVTTLIIMVMCVLSWANNYTFDLYNLGVGVCLAIVLNYKSIMKVLKMVRR